MTLLAWIVLGLIAGLMASKLIDGSADEAVRNIVLGILGAVASGWLFNHLNTVGATGFTPYSLLVGVAGAGALLILFHGFRRGWRLPVLSDPCARPRRRGGSQRPARTP